MLFIIFMQIPDEELKLNLLTKMKEDSKESEILTEVVFDAAIEVVDKFFSKVSIILCDLSKRFFFSHGHQFDIALFLLPQTSTKSGKDKLSKLAKHQSQRMGRVLGTIVARKYPSLNTTDEMTLNDLLEWYLWPNFLQIYGM